MEFHRLWTNNSTRNIVESVSPEGPCWLTCTLSSVLLCFGCILFRCRVWRFCPPRRSRLQTQDALPSSRKAQNSAGQHLARRSFGKSLKDLVACLPGENYHIKNRSIIFLAIWHQQAVFTGYRSRIVCSSRIPWSLHVRQELQLLDQNQRLRDELRTNPFDVDSLLKA